MQVGLNFNKPKAEGKFNINYLLEKSVYDDWKGCHFSLINILFWD